MPLHGFIQVDGKKEPVDSDHIEMSFGVTPSVVTAAGSSEPTTHTTTTDSFGNTHSTIEIKQK